MENNVELKEYNKAVHNIERYAGGDWDALNFLQEEIESANEFARGILQRPMPNNPREMIFMWKECQINLRQPIYHSFAKAFIEDDTQNPEGVMKLDFSAPSRIVHEAWQRKELELHNFAVENYMDSIEIIDAFGDPKNAPRKDKQEEELKPEFPYQKFTSDEEFTLQSKMLGYIVGCQGCTFTELSEQFQLNSQNVIELVDNLLTWGISVKTLNSGDKFAFKK